MTKKGLDLSEFLQLDEKRQLQILHRHGVYVGKRKEGDQTIVLFQLHSFYVEIYYRQYRKTIEKMVSSNHTEILQPYLDQINLKGFKEN